MPPDRPNILWLMTDEQRADSLGFDGSPWARTPHLDRLAGRATVFDAAYTPSPVCVAARAALLTGYAPSTTGVLTNNHGLADGWARFLTDAFHEAGYQTATFGKQHYNHRRPAFQTQVMRVLGDRVGYTDYHVEIDPEAYGVVRYPPGDPYNAFAWILAGRYPGSVDETPEARSCADALRWLGQRDPARPYLLRVSLNAPHVPAVAPEPFDRLIDPAQVALPIDAVDEPAGKPDPVLRYLCARTGTDRLDEKQILRARQSYYGTVAFVDHVLGRLLEQAGDAGALDDTIVVFLSDHGAHLGDHGFFQKQSFYDASARVPWLVALPGQATGRRVARPVSTGSLLPTLMACCGLDAPVDVDYPSLAHELTDDPGAAPAPAEPHAETAAAISEIDLGLHGYRRGDRYVMVRRGRWKLAVHRDRRDPGRLPADDGLMLHDLEADPGERINLAGSPDHGPLRAGLLAEIDAWDRARAQRHRGRSRPS